MSGFTRGFHSTIAAAREKQILIVPIAPDDLERLVTTTNRNDVLRALYERAMLAEPRGE